MLDQVMVNRALLRNEAGLVLVPDSCGIFREKDLLKRGKPRRFGRPAKSLDRDGYSDHLPIYLRLRKT